ncbi:MAG: glycosyltransferase family 2 protein [Pseudomonadota bacterium]
MKRFWDILRLRVERRKLIYRSYRKYYELTCVRDRTDKVQKSDLILFFCARNEGPRLPYFFEYYRKIGVRHFFVVDNGSDDESVPFLTNQEDCSFWTTTSSYKSSRFGMDWLTALQNKYAAGHWTLTVDPDEFLVFPHQDKRPFAALLDWLDASSQRSFGTLLLDLYPRGDANSAFCRPGENPLDVSPYFDAQNYQSRLEPFYQNIWVQGGPRQRVFFTDKPDRGPALNKIPLVKWQKGFVYRSSMHQLLPRALNVTYRFGPLAAPCGCLLHYKFLSSFAQKAEEEIVRKQHFAASREYRAYNESGSTELWTKNSVFYTGWQQLEKLGLMSRGDWV